MTDVDKNRFATAFDVPPGYHGETPYSPTIDEGFVGIKISAPSVVKYTPGEAVDRFGSFAYIPVSTVRRLSGKNHERFGNVTHNMTVVVVSANTGKTYVASLMGERPTEPLPASLVERRRRMKESMRPREPDYVSGYWTFNLASYVKLPQVDDEYHVHLTLEEFQSNVVSIEVKATRD